MILLGQHLLSVFLPEESDMKKNSVYDQLACELENRFFSMFRLVFSGDGSHHRDARSLDSDAYGVGVLLADYGYGSLKSRETFQKALDEPDLSKAQPLFVQYIKPWLDAAGLNIEPGVHQISVMV